MVTTFSFTPKKETYYACPYCLSRNENKENGDQKTRSINQEVFEEPEKQDESKDSKYYIRPENKIEKTNASLDIKLNKIENLEKQKKNLLAELYELREKATRKIYILEKEVTTLKQEAEDLKKLLEK
jgi:hypothetical protein